MDADLAKCFGVNLRRARRRADISQAGLAQLAGLNRMNVGALERGERLPRLDTILKLAAGVDASPCVLLAGLSWQPGHYVEGSFNVATFGEGNADAGSPTR